MAQGLRWLRWLQVDPVVDESHGMPANTAQSQDLDQHDPTLARIQPIHLRDIKHPSFQFSAEAPNHFQIHSLVALPIAQKNQEANKLYKFQFSPQLGKRVEKLRTGYHTVASKISKMALFLNWFISKEIDLSIWRWTVHCKNWKGTAFSYLNLNFHASLATHPDLIPSNELLQQSRHHNVGVSTSEAQKIEIIPTSTEKQLYQRQSSNLWTFVL